MTSDAFEYDVAISFAEEDKAIAEELANRLIDKNMNVLHDEYKSPGLWGKNIVDHLVNLYARKARYCVLLISGHYPLKAWTEVERTSAQEHALRDADEYILPVLLDDREVPGIREAKGYRDLRQHSMESIVDFLEGKLKERKSRSGPPPQSHDLRSGNIPSTRPTSDGEAVRVTSQSKRDRPVRQDRESIYRQVIDAISRDEAAALDSFLVEDLIDHNPIPDQSPGRTGFKEWMRSARTSFPDLHGTVEDVLLAGENRLVGRVTWRGTQQGLFSGLPPTHKEVAMSVIHIVRFEGDQIVEWWGLADIFGAVRQLGGKVILE